MADRRRKRIKIDDIICLQDITGAECFYARVTNLLYAQDFAALLPDCDISKTGYNNRTEILHILQNRYTEEQQNKYTCF